MDKSSTFQNLLTTQNFEIPIGDFLLNLILAAILSYILGKVYVRYGRSLSNRKAFARNFVILALTTTLIITIVKSSLALSLGLVGALSIVRFRAAIKEPEELAYLFLTIGIGLGFGADQLKLTVVAYFAIIISILIIARFQKAENDHNLNLVITGTKSKKVSLPIIINALTKYCKRVNLTRFDDSEKSIEASFLVEFEDINNLNQVNKYLQGLGKDINVTFVDNKGLI